MGKGIQLNMGEHTLLTVGHSTHPIDEFIAILRAHGVRRIVDVRTVPKSRHNPQFAREVLQASLPEASIGYTYMGDTLGGFRRPTPDSINQAWRNLNFRGYADYMQTPQFAAALHTLEHIAEQDRTAIMCAEAVPWRCHRSLIADALLARHWTVYEITSATAAKPRKLPDWARITRDGRITYPLSERLGFEDPQETTPLPARAPDGR